MKRATISRLETLDYAGTEALNTVCTNLSFSRKNTQKVVFTSCISGDGKSFLTMQIAVNLARRGKRVVLVDADLRKSVMVKTLGMQTADEWRGLAHYLTGQSPLEDVLYATNLPGVCIIPIGRDVSNPIPLLASADFRDLLDTLAKSFDMVLVDSPPIGLVVDTAEIAKACDGIVLVLNYNETRRREAIEAKKQLMYSGCPILGCILNKVRFDTLSEKRYYNRGYYSHYNSEYYRRATQKRKKKSTKA